jgi:hypothetical protein
LNVPTDWTTYTFDLNAFTNIPDRSKIHINIWLNPTVTGYGEMLVDEIYASNNTEGTAPVLDALSVNHNTGTEDTDFLFSARYTDVDNQKPYAIQVVIDGVVRDMEEVDSTDTDYANGKEYVFQTKLPAGSHSYYFRATDTTSEMVHTSLQNGPVVSVNGFSYEAEGLKHSAISGGDTRVPVMDSQAGGAVLDKFNNNSANDYLEYAVYFPQAGSYDLQLKLRTGGDSGICAVWVNGNDSGTTFDAYQASPGHVVYDVGVINVTEAGYCPVRVIMIDKNPASKGYKLFVDAIVATRQ